MHRLDRAHALVVAGLALMALGACWHPVLWLGLAACVVGLWMALW